MELSFTDKKKIRKSFGRLENIVNIPDLIEVQKKSYDSFLQFNENKKSPYTDDQLTKLLNGKGYPIARRTVAKYREMIGSPVARLRKKL